ncbi:MAG: hypothetical protein LQ350_005901 [Teloschistes chrysophthalmus]|nr:MAG: hypothetical protein LQ350_005901 [Niorma chrysophthalma]
MSDQELRERYEILQKTDNHKNDLIQELLHRLGKLGGEYQQIVLDHQREIQFNRDGQLRERDLREKLRRLEVSMDRDPFVLVLIDGDGMIFEEDYIQKGEMGGKEAAAVLWNKINDHIHDKLPQIPADCKIVTRVYANMKGLADACYRSGMADRPGLIEEFYRGFTGSKILFDFIDVGPGKDRADDKITELFKLHLSDFHCQHIFFGCSHDNGYARLLEQYTDPTITQQITLLEGVPFERELYSLQARYSAVRFDNVFRTNKINIYIQPQYPTAQPAPLEHALRTSSDNGAVSSNGVYQSPYQPLISPNAASPGPSIPSVMNPKALTWASTANSAAQLVSPPPTPAPAPSQPATSTEIRRNRYGQRIDPPSVYDKDEVNRLRNMKLCNVHYLRGDCPYDPCTHNHKHKITNNEKKGLSTLARMIPCIYGSECDEPKCFYGHRCTLSVTGKKDCIFGENCKFDKSLHGIDLNVVKTTKIGKN